MKINNKLDIQIQILIFTLSFILMFFLAKADNIRMNIKSDFIQFFLPKLNAYLNIIVSILIFLAIFFIKKGMIKLHRILMKFALLVSAFFLISFFVHVFGSGILKYGDKNLDGIVSITEELSIKKTQFIYYFILSTHIILASFSLPFILLTAYKGIIGDFTIHKKLGRIVYPVWLYVTITGPIVYFLMNYIF